MDIGEIENAISNFEVANLLAKNNFYPKYEFESCFGLAFCYSCLGVKNKAFELAKKVEDSEVFRLKILSAWNQGYSLLFIGLTYKNLGKLEKSFEIFHQAISFAEKSHYTQVKARALSGLAELYRIKEEFTTALSHNLESIELLEKIGAKCDLAEANYQLALTHQKMGDFAQSQEFFQKAIQLFTEMEAPKQIEKVKQSILPS